jgi:hypothetical protein
MSAIRSRSGEDNSFNGRRWTARASSWAIYPCRSDSDVRQGFPSLDRLSAAHHVALVDPPTSSGPCASASCTAPFRFFEVFKAQISNLNTHRGLSERWTISFGFFV